jgi:hypothetical protein
MACVVGVERAVVERVEFDQGEDVLVVGVRPPPSAPVPPTSTARHDSRATRVRGTGQRQNPSRRRMPCGPVIALLAAALIVPLPDGGQFGGVRLIASVERAGWRYGD